MSKAGWIRLAVILVSLILLEGFCRAGVIPSFTVIPPSAMAQSLYRILASGKFAHDIAATLGNVSIAIAAAIPVVDVAFGAVRGGHQRRAIGVGLAAAPRSEPDGLSARRLV